MNVRLLLKLLGILSLLIGVFMLFSLIWSNPRFGQHTDASIAHDRFEADGFWGLVYASIVSLAIAVVLLYLGRKSKGKLFRKEAMAVVGLSWVLATFLGVAVCRDVRRYECHPGHHSVFSGHECF